MKKTKVFIIFILCIAFSMTLFPQYGYYGKNKVRKTKFNWQYVDTENFRVHYYTTNKKLLNLVINAAEDGFKRISDFLNIKPRERIPLIFYNSHIDFEQTNLFPGFMPLGVQAFAEPVAHRVVVQGDRGPQSLARTIIHELGHIFEYELIYGGITQSTRALRSPPLWVMEGFSEFITRDWDSFSLLTVRDNVLNDRIPELQKDWGLRTAYGTGRTAYDMGHLVYEFIEKKFGKRAVRNLLKSTRPQSLLAKRKNPFELFGSSRKIFNYEFKKYARKKFRPFLDRENPEEYSFPIGPDMPYAYSFSHQVSPTGEVLAVLTANLRKGKLDIVLISMKDGKVIKNITPGYSSLYDFIEYQFSPADGSSIAWDRNSETLACFARKALSNYLLLIDVASGKVKKKILLRDIHAPASPVFLKNSSNILFSAVKDSVSRIYSINTETGAVKILTPGKRYIRALAVSPNEKSIVYSAKTGKYYHLFLAPLQHPDKPRQLTSGKFDNITPSFSGDGTFIYFSSDEKEAFNLQGIDLTTRTLHRYTNVRTGNFFPLENPSSPMELVISSFHKGTFRLFTKDISTSIEQRELEFTPDPSDRALPDSLDQKQKYAVTGKGKYKPFKKLFINSLPYIGVGYSTNGDFLGYTYLNATDLMGDHNLSLYLASQYGYRSYQFTYTNLKNRLQYYASIFSLNYGYYYYYTNSYFSLRKQFGAGLGVNYPFSRSTRLSAGASFYRQEEDSDLLYLGRKLPFGQYFTGFATPLSVSITSETTRFANFGPLMGHTFNFTAQKFLKLGGSYQNAYTLTGDVRKYLRIDNMTLLAFRLKGFTSGGDNPNLFWLGGDNTIRAAEFRRLTGNHGFHFNAEFRFSLLHLAATPIGLIGPIRGVFFFDVGGIWYKGQSFRMFKKGGGLQLQDAISSYGFGIQTFIFGVPMHFEWVRQTDWKNTKYYGFNFWIGFDF